MADAAWPTHPPDFEREQNEWVKLARVTSWGDVWYALPDERLSASGTVASENALLIAVGHQMQVRFPDGCTATLPVVGKPHPFSYSDHGNRTEGMQLLLGFELPICGLRPWVELTEVELRRDALIYRKPKHSPVMPAESEGPHA